MRKEVKYFDPESERDLTAGEIGELPPERQIEIAKHSFFQHYEDPVHNTPNESAEDEYIYIWGGSHYAHEVLQSEFSGVERKTWSCANIRISIFRALLTPVRIAPGDDLPISIPIQLTR